VTACQQRNQSHPSKVGRSMHCIYCIDNACLCQAPVGPETATCCPRETWFQVSASTHNTGRQQLHGAKWTFWNALVYNEHWGCCPATSKTPRPRGWVRDDSPMPHCPQAAPKTHANVFAKCVGILVLSSHVYLSEQTTLLKNSFGPGRYMWF